VGYTRIRVPIEGRAVVDVDLVPEFRAIDEIVVVGYGTRLREELTGSVSTNFRPTRWTYQLHRVPSAVYRVRCQV
jgi:hypothetical protein